MSDDTTTAPVAEETTAPAEPATPVEAPATEEATA